MGNQVPVETTDVLLGEAITRGFYDKIKQGRVKEAADLGSRFTRTKLREDAWSRSVITPITIGDDELDRSVDHDLPVKIIEKEPDTKAYAMTFKGSARGTWFSGQRYAAKFFKIESKHHKKNKFELMTYQNDIRQLLTEIAQKEIARIEDETMNTGLEAVATGAQKLTLAGGLTPANVATALKTHIARASGVSPQPVGKLLMTKSLYYDLIKLPHTTLGDAARRIYDEGVDSEEKAWGIPVVTTVKSDIISANDFYILPPEDYLGKFYLLQDATLFIEMKADMIEFWLYEAIAQAIGNSLGPTRVTV